MDYAYRAFRGIKTFYNAINPATLSGAIDVIVVEQPDGEFKSTPFHVRFGKYGVFNHSDKYVDMIINGDDIDVKMKLGDSGIAYFVEECENDDVPEHMITSPLPESFGNHAGPATDEILAESAKKLEEGQRRHSLSEGGEKGSEKQPHMQETEEQSLSALQRRQNGPFSSSVFSNRRNRSLPDLSSLENTTVYDDVPARTRDDTPVPKQRSTRRPLHHSKSQAFDKNDSMSNDEILKRLIPEHTAPKRKRSIRTIPINIKSDDSDSEISEASSSVSPSPTPHLDPRDDQIADGCLSDSEVDRHRNTPEPHGSDLTDWKWGEMPETRESKIKETPRKAKSSSSWNWFLWRNAQPSQSEPHPPSINEEGISLEELLDNQDPTKVEKYLGKGDSISMSVDSGNVSGSQPASPSASNMSDTEIPFPDATTPTRDDASSSLRPPGALRSISSPTLGRPRRQKRISTSSNDEIFALSEDDLESVEEEDGKCYVRSLRLSSDKLKSLNLVRGANECRFSITTKFQGTCWCTCNIYLYKWDEQIVISDVDGTITKSDVLGHVIPAIGGTWAHSGVADLYTRIKNNGYKMVYLSSRAIGQSHTTKQYLKSIAQDSKQLPDGPVLLSPTSVLLAFRREVIERKPEEFKIAALSDLKKLFPVRQPFFAGFGNRETDVTSYRAVDIPQARILIIDPSGRVRRSDSIGYVSSYISMAADAVDYLFPPLNKNAPEAEDIDEPRRLGWSQPLDHSAFTHWRGVSTEQTSVTDDDLLLYESKRKEKK